MRRGFPIAVILILSLIILVLTNFPQKNINTQIPVQDLQGMSKLLSPFMQWRQGPEILQNLAEKFRDPSIFILTAITEGERGNRENAVALLKKAEHLHPADPLPFLLRQLYDPKSKIDFEKALLIEQEIKVRLKGWFRDKPIARLYRLRGDISGAEKIEAKISAYNKAIILKIFCVFLFWVLAFIAGILVLLRYIAIRSTTISTPAEFPQLSWGWALTFVFLFLFISTAITGIPVLLLSLPIEGSAFWSGLIPFFILLGELLGALVVIYVSSKVLAKRGVSIRDIGLRVEGTRSIRWGVGGWLVSFPLVFSAFFISYLLNADAIKSQQDVSLLFLTSSFWGKLAIAFLAVFIAPPIEEFLFRGLLYSSLRNELGVHLGVILSAFFFASVHHDVSRLLPLMALGSLFAILYEKEGSLIPPIIAHALWNAQTIIALYVLLG